MRYCVLSDIHGNWEAFQAVMGQLPKDKVDAHVFLGDLVGYGADPQSCIKGLELLDPVALVAGNHEWGVLGKLDMEYFNEYAASAIDWTRNVLGRKEIDYLGSFGLTGRLGSSLLVHGSPDQPPMFKYIHDAADAKDALGFDKARIFFVAHTHAAGVFVYDTGKMTYSRSGEVRIDNGSRYVVNSGSVGQPRDGDPRASYVIYDDLAGTFEIKRVAYDVKAAQGRILKAGLPPWLASRLSEGI